MATTNWDSLTKSGEDTASCKTECGRDVTPGRAEPLPKKVRAADMYFFGDGVSLSIDRRERPNDFTYVE